MLRHRHTLGKWCQKVGFQLIEPVKMRSFFAEYFRMVTYNKKIQLADAIAIRAIMTIHIKSPMIQFSKS